jgi:hypothetical protein
VADPSLIEVGDVECFEKVGPAGPSWPFFAATAA